MPLPVRMGPQCRARDADCAACVPYGRERPAARPKDISGGSSVVRVVVAGGPLVPATAHLGGPGGEVLSAVGRCCGRSCACPWPAPLLATIAAAHALLGRRTVSGKGEGRLVH